MPKYFISYKWKREFSEGDGEYIADCPIIATEEDISAIRDAIKIEGSYLKVNITNIILLPIA